MVVYLLLSYLFTCFFLTCLLAQVIGYEVLAQRGLIHKFKLKEDKLRLWYSVYGLGYRVKDLGLRV